MPAFTRRQYAGAAAATTITAGINTVDTTCTLAATTGWPSTGGVPFYVVIDPGTSAEEKCSATISGSTLTLTRAQDDTTASSHSSGASIYPVFTANDADEANELVAKLTTKGDLLATDGSALNRLAVGTNAHVLTADSAATNGVKWALSPETDLVTTKGDILVASAADTLARQAVGSNGQVLVADSGVTNGVAWVDPQTNRNVIINGDFTINQRAFTSLTADGYGFDRWRYTPSGATGTYSPQTFSLGAAPVAGYEVTNFARIDITTGNDNCAIQQRIESVRTFAGQTATVSFWAKGTNPTTEGGLYASLSQVFGSGGSPSASVSTVSPKFVLTANWTRYSFTLSVPSISGKTLGTTVGTDFLALVIGQGAGVSTDAWTLDIWGVQVESGSVASAFQTSTGSIQGELAACQRYYYRIQPNAVSKPLSFGSNYSANNARAATMFPVEMRIAPTALEQSGTANQYAIAQAGINQVTCSSVPSFGVASTRFATVTPVATGLLSQYNPITFVTDATNGATAYLAWSAEL